MKREPSSKNTDQHAEQTSPAQANHGANAGSSPAPMEQTVKDERTKPADSQAGKSGKAVSLSTEEHARLVTQANQAQEYKDQYLRALADVDNTKKRLHREKEEFLRYAAESVVRGLLPIIDSLDQALVAVDKQADPQAIIKGVHLIYRQLLGLLEKEGIKRIPTVGEPFDPHKHEAVAQVERNDATPDGTVVEEVQVGYTMHGKVIRPAMVKIAKRTAEPDSSKPAHHTDAGPAKG